ncbi:hypothetical protein CQW23_09589 [Capsicum baccatum]|uniref:Uncharacterized protein n=1 Tax=Capsicum baccatum TaxID=33114 RepID=A0A2G2WX91_CAPBA|nr:hypothetical protein CQW23_09589 [Capsicum baccatum]
MSASPIKTKGSSEVDSYWKKIRDLEDLMNSKVYTCSIESILEEYILFSNLKLKICKHMDILFTLFLSFTRDLKRLKEKFLFPLNIGLHWSIGGDIQADVDVGYVLSKVNCLLKSLFEYSIATRTSPRDRYWKKVKLRFDDARGTSPPVIKIPDDMDNPLRNISALIDEVSDESISGSNLMEPPSTAKMGEEPTSVSCIKTVIQGKLSKCDVDYASSLEDEIQVIIKDMDCKDVDISLLGKLLHDFFDLATLYEQARSMLHDMDVEAAREELIL